MTPSPKDKLQVIADMKEAVENLNEHIEGFEAILKGKYAHTHNVEMYKRFLEPLKESLAYIDKGLKKNNLLECDTELTHHSVTLAGLRKHALNPSSSAPDIATLNMQLLSDAAANLGSDDDPQQQVISRERSDEKHRLQNLLLMMIPDLTVLYENIDLLLHEKHELPPGRAV